MLSYALIDKIFSLQEVGAETLKFLESTLQDYNKTGKHPFLVPECVCLETYEMYLGGFVTNCILLNFKS